MLASQKEHLFEYEYDFSVDGGAVSSIALRPLPSNAKLAEGDVVVGFYAKVETAFTSGGSATVTLGNTADTDGYSVDFFSAASANAILTPGVLDGALLWDSTADALKGYYVTSASNTQNLSITVGTAALTAGKLRVYLRVVRFK
jgi:hypothetical protein